MKSASIKGTIDPPKPVTIISGFLGVGKTSLLNHILSENHGVKAGVLVNDFGAINIDAKLVVGVDGETVNLANGCVCCSIRDDLIDACLGMLQRPDPPDLLIIETSGVSDPFQVANTFAIPELQPLLVLNSILTVVDAEQFPGLQDKAAAMARVQILAADIVVLNKTDLVDDERLADVGAAVLGIAPGSRLLQVTHGQVPIALVLGTEHSAPKGNRIEFPVYGSPEAVSHAHEHMETFSTWHWTCDQPLSLPRLQAALANLPQCVYRAKGTVYLEELPDYRVVLQMVGKRSNLKDVGQWEAEDPRTEIVMIAIMGNIDTDALQQAFDACIGTGDEAQSPVLRLTNRIFTKQNS